MQNKPQQELPDDELDMNAIGKKIANLVIYPYQLLVSNLWISIVFFAVAVAVSVGLKMNTVKLYKSSFILMPNNKSEFFHLNLLQDIDLLIRKQDYTTLAEELKADETLIKSIASISFENSKKKNNVDSLNFTEITIQTTDYNQFIPIQNCLINYLESSPRFAKTRAIRENEVNLALAQTNRDLADLDSLKKLVLQKYARQVSTGENSLLSELVDPTTPFNAATLRANKKTILLTQMQFMHNFELVKKCVVIKKHFWPRLWIIGIIIVPLFMLVCVVFLHIRKRWLEK